MREQGNPIERAVPTSRDPSPITRHPGPRDAAQNNRPGRAPESQIAAGRDKRVRLTRRELRLSGEQFVEEARGLDSRRAVVPAGTQTHDEDAVGCLDAWRLQVHP